MGQSHGFSHEENFAFHRQLIDTRDLRYFSSPVDNCISRCPPLNPLTFGRETVESILFVCMGNICRSPMAAVVTKALATTPTRSQSSLPAKGGAKYLFDSAGTHAHPVRRPLDPRAQAALVRRGYASSRQQSRNLVSLDFQRYDLILAMDQAVLEDLQRRCPSHYRYKLNMFLAFATAAKTLEVPDPYYGDAAGFERVLDLCEIGAVSLLERLGRERR